MHSRNINPALPRMARQLLMVAVPSLIASTLPAQTGGTGTTGNARGSGQSMMHDSTQSVVNLLAVASKDEIEAGRLALSKATRAEVKSYAQKMVDDHTKALRQLDDSAASGGWKKADSTMWMSGSNRGGMGGTRDTSMRGGTGSTGSGSTGSGSTGSTGSGSTGSGSMRSGGMGGDSSMQGGDDARMIHAKNMEAMKKLRDASGANFDQTYMQTQVEGHEALLKALDKHQTSNTRLGGMLSNMKTTVQQHLTEARRLQGSSGSGKP